MACTSDQTGRLYVKQHPGDAQLSLDELRDMVGREGQTISNCVFSVSEYQNFPNSYLLFTMVSMHLSISHSLCSAVHNYDSLCRRSSCSPIMLSILLVILLGPRAGVCSKFFLLFYSTVLINFPNNTFEYARLFFL